MGEREEDQIFQGQTRLQHYDLCYWSLIESNMHRVLWSLYFSSSLYFALLVQSPECNMILRLIILSLQHSLKKLRDQTNNLFKQIYKSNSGPPQSRASRGKSAGDIRRLRSYFIANSSKEMFDLGKFGQGHGVQHLL